MLQVCVNSILIVIKCQFSFFQIFHCRFEVEARDHQGATEGVKRSLGVAKLRSEAEGPGSRDRRAQRQDPEPREGQGRSHLAAQRGWRRLLGKEGRSREPGKDGRCPQGKPILIKILII